MRLILRGSSRPTRTRRRPTGDAGPSRLRLRDDGGPANGLKQRGSGTIVQVGSALAYRGIPLQTAYSGAKHAVQGFPESLPCELLHAKSPVHVTMVQMPAVNTPRQPREPRRRAPRLRHPRPLRPSLHRPLAPGVGLPAPWAARRPRGRRRHSCGGRRQHESLSVKGKRRPRFGCTALWFQGRAPRAMVAARPWWVRSSVQRSASTNGPQPCGFSCTLMYPSRFSWNAL